MTASMIIKSVFEVILVGFTLWALFHEDRFVAFEQRLFSAVRRMGLRLVKQSSTGRKKCA